MNRTEIEWVRNPDGSPGYTWNPITGCLNHDNGLCKGGNFPCYAYRLANGRLKSRYLAHTNMAEYLKPRAMNIRDPFYPRFWEERLYEPVNKVRRWGRQSQVVHRQEPKGIFVCDMSDLFGIGIPEEWTRKVLDRFQYCPQHRFYLLTKQPQNLIKWSPFPDNCYVGVTATGYNAFNNALDKLKCVDAKIKYISIEPLLEPISFNMERLAYCGINWLIIGACTGTYNEMELLAERLYAQDEELKIDRLLILPLGGGKYSLQPKIEWVQEIVEAADKAGVKVFLKDNLKPMFGVMTSTEAVKYGGLFKPHLLEAITFNTNNEIIAHELRQDMPE